MYSGARPTRLHVPATFTRLILPTLLLAYPMQAATDIRNRGDLEQVNGQYRHNDRILIRWKADARIQGRPARTCTPAELCSTLGLPAGVTVKNNPAADILREQAGSQGKPGENGLHFDSFQILRLNDRVCVSKALDTLSDHPLLEYAEADGIGTGGGFVPDDPGFDLQWHHEKIGSTNAWIHGSGSHEVILAVLDTGLNTNLPEFAGRLVPGYDFVNDDTNPDDDHGHGTAVAGTAAATGNNATLIAGMTWNARIMPVKILGEDLFGYYSWWAAGVDFAVSNGVKVINLSAGGDDTNSSLERSIENAINAGVIFVSITHNDGTGTIRFPGRLPSSITVGATTESDSKTTFSNWGPEIDLVAPGLTIYTVSHTGSIASRWGTSFAAPLVSGVACLVASSRPGITQAEMNSLLCAAAADQVGGVLDTPGFDNYFGWGRLNADETLSLARSAPHTLSVTTGSVAVLQWDVPENAADKKPYNVSYSSNLTEWITIQRPSNLVYSGETAAWTDDGSETSIKFLQGEQRYYRIEVECRRKTGFSPN